jgi:hypothetical protein
MVPVIYIIKSFCCVLCCEKPLRAASDNNAVSLCPQKDYQKAGTGAAEVKRARGDAAYSNLEPGFSKSVHAARPTQIPSLESGSLKGF